MYRTSEVTNIRVKVGDFLTSYVAVSKAGSPIAAQDLVFLARLYPASPQKTLLVVLGTMQTKKYSQTSS